MFFWRDNSGLEIDLVIERGSRLQPIEIKSGETFNTAWLKSLKTWSLLANDKNTQPTICYGGNWSGMRSDVQVRNWHLFCQNPEK